jgi:heat shock protein HslJ
MKKVMMTAAYTKIGIAVALTLGALACGGSVPLTQPTPAPIDALGSGTAAPRSGLLGSWQLVSLTEAGREPQSVAEPDLFTVEFTADGRASLRADCNRCSAAYDARSQRLTVGLLACTRAYCASAPLDSTFVALVGQATTWRSVDRGLELRSEAGVLQLREGPAAR